MLLRRQPDPTVGNGSGNEIMHSMADNRRFKSVPEFESRFKHFPYGFQTLLRVCYHNYYVVLGTEVKIAYIQNCPTNAGPCIYLLRGTQDETRNFEPHNITQFLENLGART
jgi:hypothetical protein